MSLLSSDHLGKAKGSDLTYFWTIRRGQGHKPGLHLPFDWTNPAWTTAQDCSAVALPKADKILAIKDSKPSWMVWFVPHCQTRNTTVKLKMCGSCSCCVFYAGLNPTIHCSLGVKLTRRGTDKPVRRTTRLVCISRLNFGIPAPCPIKCPWNIPIKKENGDLCALLTERTNADCSFVERKGLKTAQYKVSAFLSTI